MVAADLSAAMVERCRAKGIEAHVMDFLHLDFPRHRTVGYRFQSLTLRRPDSE